MRTSPAGRLGTRLLLALALCACGGGGDEGAGGENNEGATARRLSAAAATDTCTSPPPAYAVPVLNGPWQALLDSLTADGVTFDSIQGNDTTAMVKLCRGCTTPVAVDIRASNFTPCLSAGDLAGPPRIAGVFILRETFTGGPGWNDTIPAGDTIFIFANAPAGPAMLVYDKGGNGKMAPAGTWQFWYCQDGHTGGTAQAQWRSRAATTTTAAPGAGAGGGEGDSGGNYGWMACASGCCQFYTPPPNEETEYRLTPEKADSHAPDTVGRGRNSQVNPVKPPWCNSTS